jgi:Tfp pilus assembly protein PilN
MVSLSGQGKVALGMFVDGLDVKLAHLSRTGKRVFLRDLKKVTLVRRLEEEQMLESAGGIGSDVEDAFNLSPATITESSLEDRGADSNASVILGLLGEYPRQKYQLSYSISEPVIFYHTLESDGGLKGEKLKTRIIEDLQNLRSIKPDREAVSYFKTEENNIVAIVREDGLQLINIFKEIKTFLGGRIPKIPTIGSADIALVNLIRMNYYFSEDEISILVYVGVEFSRIIFLRGTHFLHFAPIIGEGFESPMLQNTLYSRILLEQDNLAIPHIHRIILAGHYGEVDLKAMLGPQFADIEVEPIRLSNLEISTYEGEGDLGDIEMKIAEYAIPIGTAWGILDPTNKLLYSVDLLPKAIKEEQKVFKVAWHGIVVLGLIFLTALFITTKMAEKSREVGTLQENLRAKKTRMEENQRMQTQIDSIQIQMQRYTTSLALFDSLVPGSDRWSRSVSSIANGIDDISSSWITNYRSTPAGGTIINGFSVYRARIPRIVSLFGEAAVLRKVTVQKIREKIVYEFEIEVPKPVK